MARRIVSRKLFGIMLLLFMGATLALTAGAKKSTMCHGTCNKKTCPMKSQQRGAWQTTRVCAPCNDIFCDF
jgi:hypothetical protein